MIRLIRDIRTSKFTLGRFDGPPLERSPPIYTLERPWVPAGWSEAAGNPHERIPCGVKGVSCVPPGIYQLEPHNTEAHPLSLALINPDLWVYHYPYDVPASRAKYARTAVLIHPANFPEELRGCIAPGFERDTGRGSVFKSRLAYNLLMGFLHHGDSLEIIDER